MKTEEEKQIEIVLSKASTVNELKGALSWISDYSEESYILNLPPSKALLGALEAFSKRKDVDAALRKRATKLLKTYKV